MTGPAVPTSRAEWARLPFAEQIEFFRQKVNLPTSKWTDLMKAGHDRAFVVAGAQKAELLTDLRKAVDGAIAGGQSIQEFRRQFDEAVKKAGWDYKGPRDWRTRTIYSTNLSTSYAAGRLLQLKDPGLRKLKPYWTYRHRDGVINPRPLHKSWDGLTLPADHPWFLEHSPPNDWGCHCYLVASSLADVERNGWRLQEEPPEDGTYTKNGEELPAGVGYGWNYQPGATWAQPLVAKLETLPPQLATEYWASVRARVLPDFQADYAAWVQRVLGAGRASGARTTIGAMAPNELAFLAERGRLPQTAAITLEDRLLVGPKAARHVAAGDALTEAEWLQLPELLARAEVLYDNDTGKLLYVLDLGPGTAKVVVEPDFWSKKGGDVSASVRTVFKMSPEALADRRRYTPVE